MTTTRLYLIRHGQTAHSAADRFSGASDVDLADEGRRQAECLAARLAGAPLAAFYCSPPVSYTHLDVYKRQVRFIIVTFPLPPESTGLIRRGIIHKKG